MRRAIRKEIKPGEALLDIVRTLANALNGLERRILSKEVIGFYLCVSRIILISKLRKDWGGGIQSNNPGER